MTQQKKEYIKEIVYLVIVILVVWAMRVTLENRYPIIYYIGVLGTITFILTHIMKKKGMRNSIILIILVGYFLRVMLAYLESFNMMPITLPFFHSGDDDSFYRAALSIYYGKGNTYFTNYQYFISWMFHLFGTSRFMAHYVNIIIYVFSAMIFYLLCKEMHINRSNILFIGISWLAFFPMYLLLSSALLRDTLIMFWLMLSFFFYIRYLNNKGRWNLVLTLLCVLLAALLHQATFVVFFAYFIHFIVVVFFPKINKKNAIIGVCLLAIFMGICYFSPLWDKVITYYLPSNFDSLVAILTRYNAQAARANYLTNIMISSPVDLLWYIPIKFLFFWASPMPINWTSLKDVLAFLIDSVFYVSCVVESFIYIVKKKDRQGVAFLILLMVLIFGAVMGLGTMNAGTAMRHRVKMFGIMLLAKMCFVDSFRKTEMNVRT